MTYLKGDNYQQLLKLNLNKEHHRYVIFTLPRCGSWLTYDLISKFLAEGNVSFESYTFFRKITDKHNYNFDDPLCVHQLYRDFLRETSDRNFILKLEPNSGWHLNTKKINNDWERNFILKYLNRTNAEIIIIERENKLEQVLSWAIAHHYDYFNPVSQSNKIIISVELLNCIKKTFEDYKYIISRLISPGHLFTYEQLYPCELNVDGIRKKSLSFDQKRSMILNIDEVEEYIKVNL